MFYLVSYKLNKNLKGQSHNVYPYLFKMMAVDELKTPEEFGYFSCATFWQNSSVFFIFLQCSFWQQREAFHHSVFL